MNIKEKIIFDYKLSFVDDYDKYTEILKQINEFVYLSPKLQHKDEIYKNFHTYSSFCNMFISLLKANMDNLYDINVIDIFNIKPSNIKYFINIIKDETIIYINNNHEYIITNLFQ